MKHPYDRFNKEEILARLADAVRLLRSIPECCAPGSLPSSVYEALCRARAACGEIQGRLTVFEGLRSRGSTNTSTGNSPWQTLVAEELRRARAKHVRPLASHHEAAAVIREEFDEYWDEVKFDGPADRKRAELIQVAAMAQRAAEDLGLVAKGEEA